MTLEEICRPLRRDLARVEERLQDLSRNGAGVGNDAVARILRSGGKRLRPALVLFCARGCHYSGERSIRLATAMELIHTASLIHDDVIDGSSLRRGVPTVNSSGDNKLSVLLGDYLYTRVIAMLAEDGDLEVVRAVASATSKLARGEIRQTLCRMDVDLTESRYLNIIGEKTAALMACSCQVGAMLGEGGNGRVEALERYGLNLGMAFQITDDLLDLTGERRRLGKVPGNDVREGRLTLPFIHALGAAEPKDGAWLREVFRSGEVDERVMQRLREVVGHYQGIDYSRRRAREYADVCKRELRALGDSETRDALTMLADYVVARAS